MSSDLGSIFLEFDDSIVNHAAPLIRNDVEDSNLPLVVSKARSSSEVLGNSFGILSADHRPATSIHLGKGYENRLTLLEK